MAIWMTAPANLPLNCRVKLYCAVAPHYHFRELGTLVRLTNSARNWIGV